jgi:hypothetical protein
MVAKVTRPEGNQDHTEEAWLSVSGGIGRSQKGGLRLLRVCTLCVQC